MNLFLSINKNLILNKLMAESIKTIKISNLSNQTLNFNLLLNQSNSIVIKNCDNLTIFIHDKINKVIIENSKQIIILVNRLIVGFEITKSKFIIIKPIVIENFSIPYMEIYKSTIFLGGDISCFLNTVITSENSNVYNIEL
jgi:hypothetical protein